MEGERWYNRRGGDVFVRFKGRGADWRLVEVKGDEYEN